MAKGVSQQDQVSHDAINLFIDIGERVEGYPVQTFRSFRTTEGFTLQGELDSLPDHASANFGIQIPRPLITDCVRLCATLCLLADDPEIIEADVLNKDRQKYLASRDDKFVEKAHRRGKVGWLVGRVVEHTDVVLRSTDFPKMKFNQFLMAPYFGPGLLPHAQKLWIDELAVGTKRIGPLNSLPM
ncbi:MAG: hypothetical protein ACYC0X_30985 [Pirellulaceae bacterium]